MIFTAVPLSAIGGVLALWLRDMPFSISAGVGFIALFGVAVLNGIVLISHFNGLRYEEQVKDIYQVIRRGAMDRLRPVLMTATVAALGFLPMALSTSNGAEVQKPLATVVIGGLVTATLLTLVIMPVLYYLVNRGRDLSVPKVATSIGLLLLGSSALLAQAPAQEQVLTLGAAIDSATLYHPALSTAALQVRQAELGIDQARQIPATNMNLTLGQLDGNLLDYNFTVTQGLGQIGADKQRKVVARQTVVLQQRQQERLEYQIVSRVRQSWYTWTYQNLRVRKLEEIRDLYARLREKSELQYRNGAIDALDRTLVQNRLTQINQQLESARAMTVQAEKNLRQAAWIDGSGWVADTTLEALPLPPELQVNATLLAPEEERIAVAQEETRLREKELGPAFSIGYFNQSLRPSYSLMGVSAGLKIPIFRKAGEARIQEQQLQQVVATNRWQQARQQLQREVTSQSQQVRIQRNLLDTEGSALQQQSADLRRLAARQLEQGEIDYFRYFQSLDAAIQSELQYLELLHAYNQAVLQLNYFIQ